ncbi:hypothetical protein [Rhizobium ruizarguesonis]|uniref:hypothetical protein n=1 Tax=Rhizobium ruizarguesonis TaxID=2081791 RepID=UPI0010314732|nr:hypothetical protein [Rhizobium ruizarguesonis]TBB72062.1 hypothetical protein ELH45_16550 [Rhizobium ruizarguesonis]
MESNEGKGGSYIRQPDGSVKLTQRTEHPDTVYPVPAETTTAVEQVEQPEGAAGKGKGSK